MLQSMGRYLALGLMRYPLPGWDACVCVSWRVATAYRLDAHYDGQPHLLLLPCHAIQRTGAPVSTMIIGTLPVAFLSLPICFIASATANSRGETRPGTDLYWHRPGVCEYC